MSIGLFAIVRGTMCVLCSVFAGEDSRGDMAKVLQPSDPLRADHRLIRDLIRTMGKAEKVQHLPDEYEWICGCFAGLGGSWEAAAKGSVGQIDLLKKIIKHAIKNKRISPAPKWGGYSEKG